MKKLLLLFTLLSITHEKNIIGYCDIKGNVKNPGVYSIYENYTIQNVINDAGGLKKNSDTDYINLSKKVTDEMVIYIHSNKEINNIKKLSSCTCTPIYKYIECEKNEETTPTTSEITTNIPVTSLTTKVPSITISQTTTQLTKPIIKETTNTTIKTTITTNPITTKTTSKVLKLININTCTLEELINLNGLGQTKAESIIEYRNNKLFDNIEEILNVKGIGKSTFEKIKDYIKV
ncbi:MAG: helix-hairpin-helix domain-containing protein [Bacilli bacterium]|nr:helix-hairpin-helix domain-containing protein [Bacilli bacterium]